MSKILTTVTFIHSFFIISLQITLMRILSIMQWDSFVSLAISIAMLGFGVAGTMISLFSQTFQKNHRWLIPASMIFTALFIQIAFVLSQHKLFSFDSFLVFQSLHQMLRFVLFIILFFIPFFTGALALGLLFTIYVEQIHRLYFANMIGAAIGGIFVFAFLNFMSPARTIIIISIFPVLSALLLNLEIKKPILTFSSIITIIITLLHSFFPANINMSQYKSLTTVMLFPDARKVAEYNSSSSQITAVKSRYLHYSTSLSLQQNYHSPIMTHIFKNGNYAGGLPQKTSDLDILDKSPMALIYELFQPETVAIVKSETGFYALYATHKGVQNIYAIEPEIGLLKALKHLNPGHLTYYDYPQIKIAVTGPRSFFDSISRKFDAIILQSIGHHGFEAYQKAISEEYDLTIEAFEQYWKKLSDDGILYVSSCFDTPLRSAFKVTSTLVEMLKKHKVESVTQHIIAIRTWNSVAFFVKKTPYNENQLKILKSFCEKNGFDILLYPDIKSIQRQNFHLVGDTTIFSLFDKIVQNKINEVQKNYWFRIKPATDERPYFSNFLSINKAIDLIKHFPLRELYYLEVSYFLTWLGLGILILCLTIFIIFPLIKFSKSRGTSDIILYFGSIGIAFMMVEILFIQKFSYYLGNSFYSTTLVLVLMLLFSGLGSIFSNRVTEKFSFWYLFFFILVGTLIITFLLINSILEISIGSSPVKKLLIMIGFIGLPSFLMGMPFPVGMKLFSRDNKQKIAWGWGINCFMSVCAAPITTLLTIEIGNRYLFLLSAILYLIPFLIVLRKTKNSEII